MRTKAFTVLCMCALSLTSCSDKTASNNSLPFDPPAGWLLDADKSRGLAYRNPNNPKQSFRYLLLRFDRPPRLTQKQIAEEIQSLTRQDSLALESLGSSAYFAEASNSFEHDGETLFRQQFFRVDKVSTTMAEIRTVSFFCPPADADTTKPVQDAIRKGLHDARLFK